MKSSEIAVEVKLVEGLKCESRLKRTTARQVRAESHHGLLKLQNPPVGADGFFGYLRVPSVLQTFLS